jgi:hypothetical protein
MRIVVPIRHNRPLMEDDLPILSSPLPDSRSTRDACTVLHKRISQEKHIFSESPAVELRCLPHIFMTRSVPLLQLIQNEVSRVATTRGTYLPKLLDRHSLEVFPRNSKLRSMKDRLACGELFKNLREFGIGLKFGFRRGRPVTERIHGGSIVTPDRRGLRCVSCSAS